MSTERPCRDRVPSHKAAIEKEMSLSNIEYHEPLQIHHLRVKKACEGVGGRKEARERREGGGREGGGTENFKGRSQPIWELPTCSQKRLGIP